MEPKKKKQKSLSARTIRRNVAERDLLNGIKSIRQVIESLEGLQQIWARALDVVRESK